MLPIKCGVESEDSDLKANWDWPVLVAKQNPALDDLNVVSQFQNPNSIHAFASTTAIHFVAKILNSLTERPSVKIENESLMAVGVGSTTDTAVQCLQEKHCHIGFSFPDLSNGGKRENGLHWTLEQLEKKGLVPKLDLILWTKTWSISERILKDFRQTRNWQSWKTSTMEIYSLEASKSPIPVQIASALSQKQPICFSVKSGEVLDATVNALLTHLVKTTARELPNHIFFSVWEKSALARAQQLFLQTRLIPAQEFNALYSSRESNG